MELVSKLTACWQSVVPGSRKQLIFQLGTNNWQRQGEFAPGSGILHEAHHASMQTFPHTKCFSVYPSRKQRFEKGSEEWANVRVFPLDHDIPICESISPVSSYRWHQMSEADFDAYRKRLGEFCEAFIDEIEAAEGQPITHGIAHHTFLNPIIMCDINARRTQAGKPAIPFSIFAHGTALKMFHAELAGDNQAEFPMRFTPLVREVMAPNKAVNLFVISEAEVWRAPVLPLAPSSLGPAARTLPLPRLPPLTPPSTPLQPSGPSCARPTTTRSSRPSS